MVYLYLVSLISTFIVVSGAIRELREGGRIKALFWKIKEKVFRFALHHIRLHIHSVNVLSNADQIFWITS